MPDKQSATSTDPIIYAQYGHETTGADATDSKATTAASKQNRVFVASDHVYTGSIWRNHTIIVCSTVLATAE